MRARIQQEIGATERDMPKDDDEQKHEFRLEEYKSLRAEILDQIKAGDNVKILITGVWAAYYYFLFTHFVTKPETPTSLATEPSISIIGPEWIWLVPIFIPALGIIRMWTHMEQMKLFSSYLTLVEKKYAESVAGVALGWEGHYKNVKARDHVWVSDFVYFALLSVLSVIVYIKQVV